MTWTRYVHNPGLHFVSCFRFDHNVNNRLQQLDSNSHNISTLQNCIMTTTAEIRQLILRFMDSQGHSRATAAEASRLYRCSVRSVWSLVKLRKEIGFCGKGYCEDRIIRKVRSWFYSTFRTSSEAPSLQRLDRHSYCSVGGASHEAQISAYYVYKWDGGYSVSERLRSFYTDPNLACSQQPWHHAEGSWGPCEGAERREAPRISSFNIYLYSRAKILCWRKVQFISLVSSSIDMT